MTGQSLDDLDAIAVELANDAKAYVDLGRSDLAVYPSWNAMILFGAIAELERRGHRRGEPILNVGGGR